MISASPGAPSLTGYRSPKTVKYDQVFLKTWSRANRPPTLTCELSRVTLVWSTPLWMSRAWPELLRPAAVWQPLAQWTPGSLHRLLFLPCVVLRWWQHVQARFPGSQLQWTGGMLSIGVVDSLRDFHHNVCTFVWRCVVLQTSSFFRLGSRPSAAPVAYLHVALLLGVVPPIPTTLDSLWGSHKSGRF